MKKGYIPKENRKKILLICDDLRLSSGVATVAKEIVIHTSHKYNWTQMAGAIKHPEKGKKLDLSQNTNEVTGISDSQVFLYPVDGYGDPNLLKQIIELEKPDALMLFTDPRYFEWVFRIENEIRKKLPIIYLNIWDSPMPYPLWNKQYYESCDLLLSISKQTKNINKVVLGDIPTIDLDIEQALNNSNQSLRSTPILLSYLPHGLNSEIFRPLSKTDENLVKFKSELFKGKQYDFVLFFNSRNIRRKQTPDAILAWRMFLDKLPKEKADKCCFLLHTQKVDENGTDLIAVSDYLLAEYPNSILFHEQNIPAEQMNLLYNCSDGQILLTSNEGWGLSLTEAILCGKPIIANQQGGMIDQMRFEDENGNWINYSLDFPSNHRGTYKKHGEWAFPVLPSNISIQGSPMTPYISDDRCRPEDAAERIFELYNLSPETREQIGLKGREWATGDEAGFTSEHQAERFINSVDKLFEIWKPREKYELINAIEFKPDRTRKHKLIY